jgi:hypothetical protein
MTLAIFLSWFVFSCFAWHNNYIDFDDILDHLEYEFSNPSQIVRNTAIWGLLTVLTFATIVYITYF